MRVVDAEGRDVPGLGYLAVAWSAEHASRLDDLLAGRIDADAARHGADYTSAGSPAEATTDFFSGPGSAWVFVVDAKGVLPGEGSIRVPAEGNEHEVRLVLRPRDGGGRLRVRAVDEKGTAVTLVHVAVSSPLGADLWRGVLPLDGVIGPLPAGRVRLSLRPIRDREDEGWVPPLDSWLLPTAVHAEVNDGATADATVRLPSGGRLKILLRSPRDAPEGTVPSGG
jgi:hypothetical protein